MSKKPLDLTPKERKAHQKALHTKNARIRRQKERLRGYLRLVEAILELERDESLSVEQIALKMLENEQFRVIYTPKTPQTLEKKNDNEKSHKKC